MSQWATLEANFKGCVFGTHESRIAGIRDGMPTGSEDGPNTYVMADGWINVEGRLRDVSDMPDSFVVVAWFAKLCEWWPEANLRWSLDHGPAYAFTWHDGALTRVTGVLG